MQKTKNPETLIFQGLNGIFSSFDCQRWEYNKNLSSSQYKFLNLFKILQYAVYIQIKKAIITRNDNCFLSDNYNTLLTAAILLPYEPSRDSIVTVYPVLGE